MNFQALNWNKVLSTLWHASLLGASAVVATKPQYVWALPALQAIGQMSPPPDLTIATPEAPKV